MKLKDEIFRSIFVGFFLITSILGYELHTFDMWSDPGVTHKITAVGSEVQFTYGAFDSLSLVGTEFRLALTGQPETAVDFCEARSAGGAGIQYSHGMGSHEESWINNQAAGNAVGYQWGYLGEIDYNDSTDTLSYIKGTEWLPAYMDTYDADGSGPQSANAVSPVEDDSRFLHYIKKDAVVESMDDGLGGEYISLTLRTQCKWDIDTSLGFSTRSDAFYLRRDLGRECNMHFYAHGKDQSSDKDWFVGPIKPYDVWDETQLEDRFGVQRGQMLPPIEGFGGCWSMMDKSIQSYVVVVTIGNERIGFGMQNIENDVIIRLEDIIYGSNPNNDRHGSIDIGIRQPGKAGVTYEKGQITEHEIVMQIGTVDQLRKLGYWIPEQVDVDKDSNVQNTPESFVLHDNYPNPFNPMTTISFVLPQKSNVNLQVLDLRGNLIKEETYSDLPAGQHKYEFDGSNLSSGIYLYKLKTDHYQEIKKMTLIK